MEGRNAEKPRTFPTMRQMHVEISEEGLLLVAEDDGRLPCWPSCGTVEFGMGFLPLFILFELRAPTAYRELCLYHIVADRGAIPAVTATGQVSMRVVAKTAFGTESDVFRGHLPEAFSNALVKALQRQQTQADISSEQLNGIKASFQSKGNAEGKANVLYRMRFSAGKSVQPQEPIGAPCPFRVIHFRRPAYNA